MLLLPQKRQLSSLGADVVSHHFVVICQFSNVSNRFEENGHRDT